MNEIEFTMSISSEHVIWEPARQTPLFAVGMDNGVVFRDSFKGKKGSDFESFEL